MIGLVHRRVTRIEDLRVVRAVCRRVGHSDWNGDADGDDEHRSEGQEDDGGRAQLGHGDGARIVEPRMS